MPKLKLTNGAHEERGRDLSAELRAKIMTGIEQLDRGEGVEWHVEDVKAKGRALLAAQNATAK